MTVKMSCGKTRRLLWPDGGPRSASADVVEAQEHLAGCAACQRFLEEMRTTSDLVRAAAPAVTAPREVRDRLFKTVARARIGTRPTHTRRHHAIGLIAAAAVFGVLAATLIRAVGAPSSSSSDLVAALVEDHARAMSDVRIASRDPHEVSRWLERHVPFAVHVPVFPNGELRGARLCLTEGRRGAVIEYQLGDDMVSYFVMPEETPPASGSKTVRFERASRAGYQLVVWRDPGLVRAMVGGIAGSRLEELARICVEQMRTALAPIRELVLARREV